MKIKNKKRALVFYAILSLFLSWEVAAKPLEYLPAKVLVSIPPVHSLVAAVMEGTQSSPVLLMEGDEDLHSYTLKPSDAKKISDADVVFMVDEELERFMQKQLESTKLRQEQVFLSHAKGTKILPQREAHEGSFDPHMWLDINNAKAFVTKITEVLGKKYPLNAKKYNENLRAVEKKLSSLQTEIRDKLAFYKDKPFMTLHDAWQYFEKEFDLTFKGSVFADGDLPPSIQQKLRLKEKIKADKIECLFLEPQFSGKLVMDIVKEENLKTATLDALGKAIAQGSNQYFLLMRKNADSMAECFGREKAL